MSPKKKSPRNTKNKRKIGIEDLPVTIGKEYEVNITQKSLKGQGIAHIKGFPIFVPDAQVGEILKVTIKNINFICADAEITSKQST